jgi:hypothetical protein
MLDRVLNMTSTSKVCLTLGAQVIENYLKFCLENSDTACLTISLSSSLACVFFLRSCLSNFHAECSRRTSVWGKSTLPRKTHYSILKNVIRAGIVDVWAATPAYRKKNYFVSHLLN